MEDKITPGVVLCSKFALPNQKAYVRYLDYVDRNSAVKKNEFAQYTDYMDNPLKQQGRSHYSALFTAQSDHLTTAEKSLFKKRLHIAQQSGSPLWQNVISFRNDWLAKNGLYNTQNHTLNEVAVRSAVRQSMRVMLKNEQMPAAVWASAIHYNTGNLHIHIAVAEPFPTRPLQEWHGKMVRRGKLKESTLDKMKSAVVNRLVDRSPEQQRLNDVMGKSLLASVPSDLWTVNKELRQSFLSLYGRLPPNRRLWKYNMNALQKLRPVIDSLSRECFTRYHYAEYLDFQRLLKYEEQFLKSAYGESRNFAPNKTHDLYARMGNVILSAARRYDLQCHTGHVKRYSKQTVSRFKSAAFYAVCRRAVRNVSLDRALSSLRKAMNFACQTAEVQQAYKQLQMAVQRAELEQEHQGGYENDLYFGV